MRSFSNFEGCWLLRFELMGTMTTRQNQRTTSTAKVRACYTRHFHAISTLDQKYVNRNGLAISFDSVASSSVAGAFQAVLESPEL